MEWREIVETVMRESAGIVYRAVKSLEKAVMKYRTL
jgi:hypothetical protein